MNFILVFGPPAVGKMTVGQELARLTGYKLLHNHMTVDLVTEFFDFGTPQFERLVPELRRMLVREAAGSDLPGLIFTFVWDFSQADDKAFVDELCGIVAGSGGSSYFVELATTLEERLRRNRTENRRKHKNKRPVEATEAFILSLAGRENNLNSDGDFPYPDRHLKIENTGVGVEEAARRICERFVFGTRPPGS